MPDNSFANFLDLIIRNMPPSPPSPPAQPSIAPPATQPWDILGGFHGIPQLHPPASWLPNSPASPAMDNPVYRPQSQPLAMTSLASNSAPGSAPQAPSAPLSSAATGGPNDPRAVRSLTSGRIVMAPGWQNPNDPNSGLGWRVYVTGDDGSRMGYGHMDPNSTPPVGTTVKQGDYIGVYADPTNGSSTGPHVHVIQFGPDGKVVDPGSNSPVTGGRMTTPYGGKDAMTGQLGHNGVDWAGPR